MCLIVFSFKSHPRFPLIMAANRDEYYNRPALPLHRWGDESEIVAGRDEEAGGTWLGLTRSGRIAFLTNYRDISDIKQNAPSRGHLVTDFLRTEDKPGTFFKKIEKNSMTYNGFNLLAGYPDNLSYFSNKLDEHHMVEPGVHSISNALLNTSWPKTDRAKRRFSQIVRRDEPDEELLFELLTDSTRFPSSQLPDTGLSEEMEKAVSSIFIRTPDYGTRCSTVIMVDHDQHATIIEKTYSTKKAEVSNTVRIELDLAQ